MMAAQDKFDAHAEYLNLSSRQMPEDKSKSGLVSPACLLMSKPTWGNA